MDRKLASDLNVAEHAVAGIVDKTKIAAGSYTMNTLKKLINTRWDEYSQDSLDRSIESMAGRLESVKLGARGRVSHEGSGLLGG